jgi:glycosyltransferase involved in cell wall biosynthesis
MHCDAVWCNSPRQIEGRRKEGVRQHSNLIVRSLPLCISPRDMVEESVLVQTSDPILCYLGQLSPWVGIQVLIEALPRLASLYPGIHFRFIGGGGSEVEELQRLTSKLGIAKHVTFYGFITDQQKIDQLLRECSVGVALYRNHPYAPIYYGDSAKIKKYLAAGLAVVTTRAPYVAEKILEYRAGCVSGETLDEFCAAIEGMLTSPDHLLQCRKNALALARSYKDSVIMSDVWRDFDSQAPIAPVNSSS